MWPSTVRTDSETASAISRLVSPLRDQQGDFALALGERHGEPSRNDRWAGCAAAHDGKSFCPGACSQGAPASTCATMRHRRLTGGIGSGEQVAHRLEIGGHLLQ